MICGALYVCERECVCVCEVTSLHVGAGLIMCCCEESSFQSIASVLSAVIRGD